MQKRDESITERGFVAWRESLPGSARSLCRLHHIPGDLGSEGMQERRREPAGMPLSRGLTPMAAAVCGQRASSRARARLSCARRTRAWSSAGISRAATTPAPLPTARQRARARGSWSPPACPWPDVLEACTPSAAGRPAAATSAICRPTRRHRPRPKPRAGPGRGRVQDGRQVAGRLTAA